MSSSPNEINAWTAPARKVCLLTVMSVAATAWKVLLCLLLLALSISALGSAMDTSYLLAAMPVLGPGLSQIGLTCGPTAAEASIAHAVTAHLSAHGWASSDGRVDLGFRLRLPVDLSPAFFGVEVRAQGLVGLMTLFLGPVSLDLGRSWAERQRWAMAQLSVHPQMVWLAVWRQDKDGSSPHVGMRCLLDRTVRWEAGILLGREVTGWLGITF